MNRSTFLAHGSAVALLLASSAAFAKTDSASFVREASVANKFEIESSRLALKQAKDSDVKSFAQQMVDDHTKAGANLRTALGKSKSGLAPEDKLDAEHQKKLTELQSLSGDAFDDRYVSIQQDAHKQAVALFSDYGAHGDDADLKKFANETLPTLQHHEKEVKELD